MLILFFFAFYSSAYDIYIAKTGLDTNDGTEQNPVLTIQEAISRLSSNDNIFISAGRYEEASLLIQDLDSITISAHGSGEVIIDGTREIQASWSRVSGDNHLWQMSPEFPFWQLFQDGEMVGLARFPNSEPWSAERWDLYSWRSQAPNSAEGTMIDKKEKCESAESTLAGQDKSFEGCIATLNLGHWLTTAKRIDSHTRGSPTFSYVYDLTQFFADAHYYIECLAALDAPGEWGYDWENNLVYYWPMNDEDPNTHTLRGKTMEYLIYARAVTGLTITGLTFYGGGVSITAGSSCAIEGCMFDHSSYPLRALGSDRQPAPALALSDGSNNIIRDCEFQFIDAIAINLNSENSDLVENCEFHQIDTNVATTTFKGTINYLGSDNCIIRDNTFNMTGSSATLWTGGATTVESNLFINTGLVQTDTAAVQIGIGSQPGSQVIDNWSWWGQRLGYRFDSSHDSGGKGEFGTMTGNVAFGNYNGFSVKGDNHTILHNTAVYNDWSTSGFTTDLLVWINNLGQTEWPYNLETVTNENLAGVISGMAGSYTPLNNPGDNWHGYENGMDPAEVLKDPLHGDYRPKDSQFQYGAYTGADTGDYHIPGRKQDGVVRMPLPYDGSIYVPVDVELKWQHCKDQCTYTVYFGPDPDHLSREGTTASNVLPISQALAENNTYFWRVDTQANQGEVWSFTTGTYLATCDEQVVVSELQALASALTGVWGNQRYCESEAVRQVYEESTYFKKKTCNTAACGRAQRFTKVECDFTTIAVDNSISGNPTFLAQIADNLSSEDCFGIGETCDAEVFDDVTEFQVVQSDFVWSSCHFDFLLQEMSALVFAIGDAGAWPNQGYCSNADVEAFFRSTNLAYTDICTEEQRTSAATFALSSWFATTVVPRLRDCYPYQALPEPEPTTKPEEPHGCGDCGDNCCMAYEVAELTDKVPLILVAEGATLGSIRYTCSNEGHDALLAMYNGRVNMKQSLEFWMGIDADSYIAYMQAVIGDAHDLTGYDVNDVIENIYYGEENAVNTVYTMWCEPENTDSPDDSGEDCPTCPDCTDSTCAPCAECETCDTCEDCSFQMMEANSATSDVSMMTCTQPVNDFLGGRMYSNVNVIAALGLDSGNELWVCDEEWYVKNTATDMWYPTCVYYGNGDVAGACDNTQYVCAGATVIGSRGEMNAALRGQASLDSICYDAGFGTRADFMNKDCPRIKETCSYFGNYFMGVLASAGVDTETACSLCVPEVGGDKVGAVKMVTMDGYKNLCVGYSDESLTECPVSGEDDYVCSGSRSGMQIFGWPTSQAASVRVALDQQDMVHPQCRDYMPMPMP